MIPKSRELLIRSLKGFDIAILIFTMLIVVAMTHPPTITLFQFFAIRRSLGNVAVLAAFAIVWHWILCCNNLYVSRRLSAFRSEAVDVAKATTFGTIVLALFWLAFNIKMINVPFLVLFWANVTALTLLGRGGLRLFLRHWRRKGRNLRNVVIAGAHHRALLFADEVLAKPELGYHLVGFVDDPADKCPAFDRSGYQIVATFDTFNEFLRKQVVDEVAICLPVKSHYQQAAHIASICEEHGIIVRFLSDIFNPKLAHAMTQQFEGHAIITFYTGNMEGGRVIIKRVLDFIIALLLIVMFSPLFIVAALLVRLSSSGPILFVQKRLGLNKHHFDVYKFRTMYTGAELKQAELEHLNEVQGAAFKIKDDPRVTPLGKILRKTSLDELPQLFNVLKGEMSLVGPRPLPIRDYEGFNKDWHRRRFSVRPGITCLWQVSGRSNISFERWMELDMEYIDNWSLWLDFKILCKTFAAVVRRDGAV